MWGVVLKIHRGKCFDSPVTLRLHTRVLISYMYLADSEKMDHQMSESIASESARRM